MENGALETRACAVPGCDVEFVPSAAQQRLCEPNCRSRRRYGLLVETAGALFEALDQLQAAHRVVATSLARMDTDNPALQKELMACRLRLEDALRQSDSIIEQVPIARPD